MVELVASIIGADVQHWIYKCVMLKPGLKFVSLESSRSESTEHEFVCLIIACMPSCPWHVTPVGNSLLDNEILRIRRLHEHEIYKGDFYTANSSNLIKTYSSSSVSSNYSITVVVTRNFRWKHVKTQGKEHETFTNYLSTKTMTKTKYQTSRAQHLHSSAVCVRVLGSNVLQR